MLLDDFSAAPLYEKVFLKTADDVARTYRRLLAKPLTMLLGRLNNAVEIHSLGAVQKQ